MSARVTITLDADRLLEDSDADFTVDGAADYAQACVLIREALKKPGKTTIRVRNRAAGTWLTNRASAYGEKKVALHRYTPRVALEERWGVVVPPDVTDPDIISGKLLDERVSARESRSFSDVLLGHFYQDILTSSALPLAQLDALLEGYDPDRWKDAGRRAVVARTYNQRLDRWRESAKTDSARKLTDWLRVDPAELRRSLAAYKILKRYPTALGEKVLSDSWEVFRKAKVETEALSVSWADPKVTNEVEYHLAGVKSDLSSPDDVTALVDQMSGHLDVEFEFIERVLKDRTEWVGADVIRRIAGKFRPLKERVEGRIAGIRKLIKPTFPSAPFSTWGAGDWLRWVQAEYMPYYAWLEAQNKHEDTVAAYAAEFAGWFYENFSLLKNGEPERFSFGGLYRERERITTEGAVALALIVDNLNFVHVDELSRIFRSHGLSEASREPLFSLMPTATEVGKAALIAMTGDQIDVQPSTYPGLVQEKWSTGKRKAEYLPNIGALQQLAILDKDVYFLNFLPVDEALHQNAQDIGRTHGEVIREHFATLAKSVANFAKRFQVEKRLLVYVLSDHGSTRIAHGVVNVLDKSYYKALADQNHHRYVAVSDEKLASVPAFASQQCYVIDRYKFKTNQNYLAARAYYRFIETTGDFFVHGGLTPEEVVVPFSRFTFSKVQPANPTLTLLGNQFRFAVKSRVRIEVGNPNTYPLQAISLRLVDMESEEVTLEALGPKETQVAELVTIFKKGLGGADRTLTVRLRYSYQDTDFAPPDAEFPITIKSVMEEKDDLGDIF
jgi:hypothetical protein